MKIYFFYDKNAMLRIFVLSKRCDLCEVQLLLRVNVVIRVFVARGFPNCEREKEVRALPPRIRAQMAAEYVRLRALSKPMLRHVLAIILDELSESKHRGLY